MDNYTFTLVLLGLFTAVNGLFRLIDWIEEGDTWGENPRRKTR